MATVLLKLTRFYVQYKMLNWRSWNDKRTLSKTTKYDRLASKNSNYGNDDLLTF